MAGRSRRQQFLVSHKKPLKAVVIALAAATLAVPLLIVGLSPGGFSNASFSALRLLALYAFTLIFIEIVTGAMRMEFYILFKPARVYRFHVAAGALGFCMALAHGATVIATKHIAGHPAVWVIGPIALGLLAVTAFVALDKRRLPRVWRRIHQVNYLIFVAIFVKAAIIGTDVRTIDATAHVMRAVMVLYVVVAAAATAVRIADYRRMAARSRRPAGEVEDVRTKAE
ncbi:MAG: hypothetical protein ACYC99_10515 [Candidatus Geothermincolia bacterium]